MLDDAAKLVAEEPNIGPASEAGIGIFLSHTTVLLRAGMFDRLAEVCHCIRTCFWPLASPSSAHGMQRRPQLLHQRSHSHPQTTSGKHFPRAARITRLRNACPIECPTAAACADPVTQHPSSRTVLLRSSLHQHCVRSKLEAPS